jgi:putative Mn2+ efflux pump MntP
MMGLLIIGWFSLIMSWCASYLASKSESSVKKRHYRENSIICSGIAFISFSVKMLLDLLY